ncbi:hypothetical protein OHC33_002921 [Knufia fluminis]|uniref:Uncharacterized protein n=1 Tax=Knufia fluminis TaxID=191047 RepID=A0AAN8I7S3_9EURO|nr:hypothetical protein OHC33_002921 [Knufia fluminis]
MSEATTTSESTTTSETTTTPETTTTSSETTTTTSQTTSTTTTFTGFQTPEPSANPIVIRGDFEKVPDSKLYSEQTDGIWTLGPEVYFYANGPYSAFSTVYGDKFLCTSSFGQGILEFSQALTNVPTESILTLSYAYYYLPYPAQGSFCSILVFHAGYLLDIFDLEGPGWMTRNVKMRAGSANGNLVFQIDCTSQAPRFTTYVLLDQIYIGPLPNPSPVFDGSFEFVPQSSLYSEGASSDNWALSAYYVSFYDESNVEGFSSPYGDKFVRITGGSGGEFLVSQNLISVDTTQPTTLQWSYNLAQQFGSIGTPCTFSVSYVGTEIDRYRLQLDEAGWQTRVVTFTPAFSSGTLQFYLGCYGEAPNAWTMIVLLDNIYIGPVQ